MRYPSMTGKPDSLPSPEMRGVATGARDRARTRVGGDRMLCSREPHTGQTSGVARRRRGADSGNGSHWWPLEQRTGAT